MDDGQRIPGRRELPREHLPGHRGPAPARRPDPLRRPEPSVDEPTRPVAPQRPRRSVLVESPTVSTGSDPRWEPPTRPVPRTTRPAHTASADRAGPGRRTEPSTGRPAAQHRGGARRRRPRRTLGTALLATAAATVVPGSGHLMLRRHRAGGLILGVFLLGVVAVALVALTAPRSDLLENLLSTRVLLLASVACVVAGLAWIAVVVRTYLLARPRGLDPGRQAVGALAVVALCLLIAAPFGFAANLANSQRILLDTVFAGGGGGTAVAEAIAKPRLNILLVGSDAGPDRTGTRTDTMMVASVDTRSGRVTLFGLPRNIGFAQFPPESRMGQQFPAGFHDRNDPGPGDYLLNAVYAYGLAYPDLAPPMPTSDPGLNLLHQTVSFMLGLRLDYYVEVNMAGFASIIDALGGLTVDVGPERIPIGGITPSGRQVRPDGYIEAGIQDLTGEQALAYARSRTGSTDYARMGRQRCLLQNILSQKSPADLLSNFQAVAKATTNSVSTNIPQEVLPALVSLAGEESVALESVSFDPSLPDASEADGRFDTGRPNFDYMQQVVRDAIERKPATPTTASPPTSTAAPAPESSDASDSGTPTPPVGSAAPTSLARSCA